MNQQITVQKAPSSPLQNAQSLLHSAAISATEKGHYGIANGEYDFIPGKGFSVTVGKQLLPAQIIEIENANTAAKFGFVMQQLSRLSLHKHMRAGEATASAFFSDVASDIAGYGELTVVEACARLRRAASPFYPTSAEIIAMCERVKAEIDALITLPAPSIVPRKYNKETEWKPPTETDKANVASLVQEALRNLGAA